MDSQVMTVRAIADLVGGTVEGDETVRVTGVAAIATAGPDEITFAVDGKRALALTESAAGAAIAGAGDVQAPMPLVRVENVDAAVAKLLEAMSPGDDLPAVGVHPSAAVAPDAVLADDVAVAPGVVIGPRTRLGAGCALCANVSLGADVELGERTVLQDGVAVRRDCQIGSRVHIGPNSVIGADGFGYFTAGGVHRKVPHIGNVVIEDDVELGACVCVDRAKFGSTRIGAGTKIDNLVQVAHNVQIGKGCLIAGQCGIAGSASLGDFVVMGGGAGIRDNISIGKGAQCAAVSAVANDVPDGQVVAGIPAVPARDALRIVQSTAKLPELLKRVKALESRLKAREPEDD